MKVNARSGYKEKVHDCGLDSNTVSNTSEKKWDISRLRVFHTKENHVQWRETIHRLGKCLQSVHAISVYLNIYIRVDKMVQQVKLFASMPNDLYSIPRSHMMRGEYPLPQVVL